MKKIALKVKYANIYINEDIPLLNTEEMQLCILISFHCQMFYFSME